VGAVALTRKALPSWPAVVAAAFVICCTAAVGVLTGSDDSPAGLPSAFLPSAAPSAGTLAAGGQVLAAGTLDASSAAQPSAPWQYTSPAATTSAAVPSVPGFTRLPATTQDSSRVAAQVTSPPPSSGRSSAPAGTATGSGIAPSVSVPAPTVRPTASAPSAPVPTVTSGSTPPAVPTPAPATASPTAQPAPSPIQTRAPAGTTVPAAPAGFAAVFSDSFDGAAGSAPALQNWFFETAPYFGANQWTTSASNAHLDGSGDLVIQANQSGGTWTSAEIETTRDDFAAPPGGKLELTASVEMPDPDGALGYWPAFWAAGAPMRSGGTWPASGEIDMLESENGLNGAAQTFHFGASNSLGGRLVQCPGATACLAGYHTYSVLIDRTNTSAETLRFLIDGTAQATYTEAQVGTAAWQAAIDHGFFLLLDLAMGGASPDRACGCTTPTAATTPGGAMRVGYVAVYEQPAQ
jgi:beta-glucanase (GH16 family)